MKSKHKFLIALIGALGTAGVVTLVINLIDHFGMLTWDTDLCGRMLLIYAGVMLGGGLLFFALAPGLKKLLGRFTGWLVGLASERPLPELLLGLTGSIMGLLIAFFISSLINGLHIGMTGIMISAMIYFALGSAGYSLMGRRWSELPFNSAFKKFRNAAAAAAPGSTHSVPKILDTSVLVDGRIFDICQTGFMEGPLVLPQFVLEELQHIADSSDSLKRNRGRRGLDVVARIQKELEIELRIDDTNFEDVADVDIKLLKLTQLLNGRVVTNDYNLNKVAGVSGVSVLNINELANALKPVMLPGEELTVQIVREGKELGQGVAFMDDGTMIVVENGRKFIGQTIAVSVNTVLQTSAGRMIFAKLREKAAV